MILIIHIYVSNSILTSRANLLVLAGVKIIKRAMIPHLQHQLGKVVSLFYAQPRFPYKFPILMWDPYGSNNVFWFFPLKTVRRQLARGN